MPVYEDTICLDWAGLEMALFDVFLALIGFTVGLFLTLRSGAVALVTAGGVLVPGAAVAAKGLSEGNVFSTLEIAALVILSFNAGAIGALLARTFLR